MEVHRFPISSTSRSQGLQSRFSIRTGGDREFSGWALRRSQRITRRRCAGDIGREAEAFENAIDHTVAPRAQERKCTVQDRAKLRTQDFAQRLVRAMKARLDGVARNAQAVGRLLDAHLLDRAHDENRTGRAAATDRLHSRWHGGSPGARWHVGAHVVLDDPRRIAARAQRLRDLVYVDGRMPIAEPAERLIEHDTREPGSQTRFALETVTTAIARELAGFVWAIARQVMAAAG